jgi:hypothetical protein
VEKAMIEGIVPAAMTAAVNSGTARGPRFSTNGMNRLVAIRAIVPPTP